MLLVRTYLTELIKSGKFKASDVVKAEFGEIQKLSLPCLRRLVEEFYRNYQKSEEFDRVNKLLNEHLEKKLPLMGHTYKSILIKHMTFGINKAEFSSGLLEKVLETLASPKELYFNKIEASLLVRFLPEMQKNKVAYEESIRRYFGNITVDRINTMHADDIDVICAVLIATGEINKFFDVQIEGVSIFALLENVYNENFKNFQVRNEFVLLKCFIINDRGHEDFIRKLEKNVFSSINELEDRDLAEIPGIYKKRILHNSNYIIDKLFKNLYSEFVSRFESINGLTKSTFLFNYWKNSTYFGMFCDGSLAVKIKQMLKQIKSFEKMDPESRNLLIVNSISYLSHARQLDNATIIDLKKIIMMFSNSIKEKSSCHIMTYISRHSSVDLDLLSIYLKSFKFLFSDLQYHSALYHIYLNLKYQHPSVLPLAQDCYTIGNLSVLESNWRKKREKDLLQPASSQAHREIQFLLKKMGVEYSSEYYDDYFIDIAIVKHNISIEISGPGHYIFPGQILNGRTNNKHQILQAKGWRHYNFPYFQQKSAKIFLSQIIPFE